MTTRNHYRYLSTLAVFYSIAMFSSGLVTHKLIDMHGFVVCGASLIVPIWYLLGDVITEVYGYQACRQLIWATMAAYIIYAFALKIIINMPSPSFWHLQSDYIAVLGVFVRISFAGTIAGLVGGFTNSIVISKWKILMQGRSFWLRSLGSSIFGQTVYVLIVNVIAFMGSLTVLHLVQVMLISLLIKIIWSVIGVIPSSVLTATLKRKEGIDHFDYNINFNPFKVTSNKAF